MNDQRTTQEDAQRRCDRENRLLEAVRQGQRRKAEAIWELAKHGDFTQQWGEPLRAMKNDGVILNTLLRKAAEAGGVHPAELESLSSDLAQQIEQAAALGTLRNLMGDMIRAYCRLVHHHTMKDYSAPVRKTILLIKADLSANLTLRQLAAQIGLSGSYLSTLFRRETGQTITQFVTHCRIQKAKQLLSGTNLQVQTVAQHCGMVDRHYFSRMFKKETGMTPNQYRQSAR